MIDHICLVQHDPDLVLMPLHRLNAAAELVGDVQLVCVKEEKNSVNPLGKPLYNTREVIPTVPPLFLTTRNPIRRRLEIQSGKDTQKYWRPEDARSVNKRDSRQHRRRTS